MRREAGLLFTALLGIAGTAQTIHGRDGITLPPPPVVNSQPVIDNYFGTNVTDNFRWLENSKSPETRAFIDEQNAYTTRYLKQTRIRTQIVDDLDPLEHTTRWSIPIQRAGNFYFMKRLAGEEQASIYVRHGWSGPTANSKTKSPGSASAAGKDERLIDPASFSRDSNTSVQLADVAHDGLLIAYEVRQGGADEGTVRIYSLTRKKALEDELPAGVYYSIFFSPDGRSLYYARTDPKGTLLYLHTIGTRNSDDKLIFGREFHGELLGPIDLFTAEITDDDRYLVITIQRGIPPTRVDICFRDLKKPGSPFEVLVWGLDARFSAKYFKSAWFVRTDYTSPNYRILRADPGIMPEAWKTVIPEDKDVTDTFNIVGGKLYVKRLHDVKSEISVYSLDGKEAGQVGFESIGTASDISGRTIDRYGFFSFESYIQPPAIYRIDTVTGKREPFAEPKTAFKTTDYDLKQVFFKSADGTRIPMFIAGKKGLKQDGSERLLMTGYGGFNLSETPAWNPAWGWWLQQGGWFAVPNLRGGGEYGESWHEQGMFSKKQNVFDDWFAAARFLIDQKYASAQHLAISGRSNGGLLMGASITQHPELFSAVWCGYPLLDMLRYHKFEQGPHWTTEYGSAEKRKDFAYLYKYSPYQNVKPSSDYPAVMFFTGDSDTRVDPLHARKMTALLQFESKSGRPTLLHYSTTGGHSAGVSVEQQIQDDADQLSFLWTESGSPSRTKQPQPPAGVQP